MSLPARIAGVLMEPGKAFADIAARPTGWWLPMVLVIVTSLVFVNLYSQRVGWERMMRHELETSSRTQQMSAEQREAALTQMVKFTGIVSYVGPLVGTPLSFLAMAGVLMLMMNSVMGGQSSYKQSLSIVSYSMLPSVISGILAIVVMFIKSPDEFDIRNPLAFNAGALVGTEAPKWLTALATSFDLFTFWMIGLLAIGFAATSRKMTVGKALTGIVTLWALVIVCKVGWTAMFS